MQKIHLFIHATLLLCATMMISGCVLEDITEYGDKCPADSEHTLSYIVADRIYYDDGTHWRESYLYNYCPSKFPNCAVDSQGHYYCMTTCPETQIGCDGKCIDPLKDPNYCGASRNNDTRMCENFKVCNASQTCTGGKCIDIVCKPSETRCNNGRIEECIDMQWSFVENCPTGECYSDWSCASSHCTNNDARCVHNRYESCQNGTWTTILTCKSGFSCNPSLGCIPNDTCTTTFTFYDPWTAINSGGKDDYDVYLVGSFNLNLDGAWKQTDPKYKMTPDGNGLHTLVVDWPINSTYEYKYYVDGWAEDSWKTDAPDGISNSTAHISTCGMNFGASPLSQSY